MLVQQVERVMRVMHQDPLHQEQQVHVVPFPWTF